VYRKFLNARSPLRRLEEGLHGGLGPGNVGVVVAGHGVGKTCFLVGVALDELLRGGRVLHVSLEATVQHVRAFYDTVFEELASSTQLEDAAVVHAEVDRRRSIRVYPPGGLDPAKLREAVALEAEAAERPSLVIVEGLDFGSLDRMALEDVKKLAVERAAEIWLSAASPDEQVPSVPEAVARFEDLVSVILALEPGLDSVGLRALKDHDNADLSDLRVSLDPHTLLLTRS